MTNGNGADSNVRFPNRSRAPQGARQIIPMCSKIPAVAKKTNPPSVEQCAPRTEAQRRSTAGSSLTFGSIDGRKYRHPRKKMRAGSQGGGQLTAREAGEENSSASSIVFTSIFFTLLSCRRRGHRYSCPLGTHRHRHYALQRALQAGCTGAPSSHQCHGHTASDKQSDTAAHNC